MAPALEKLKVKLGNTSTKAAVKRSQESLTYAWPALRLALTVLEKTLDGVPIPGLKGAVGGILVLSKSEEVAIQNLEDVRELQKQISVLSGLMQRWRGVDKLPLDLERRIQGLFSDLSVISDKLLKITSRGVVRRFFTSEDDAANILQLIREISLLVQNFQLDAVISVEVAVRRGFEDIQQTTKIQGAENVRAVVDAIRNLNSEDPVLSLPRANGAYYDAGERQGSMGCLEETRVNLLQDIESWMNNVDKEAAWLFIMRGLAGTGKSTISHSVCEKAEQLGILGASFFFSRNEANTSNPFLVFTTIAFQLATRFQCYKDILNKNLRKNPDIARWSSAPELSRDFGLGLS